MSCPPALVLYIGKDPSNSNFFIGEIYDLLIIAWAVFSMHPKQASYTL